MKETNGFICMAIVTVLCLVLTNMKMKTFQYISCVRGFLLQISKRLCLEILSISLQKFRVFIWILQVSGITDKT